MKTALKVLIWFCLTLLVTEGVLRLTMNTDQESDLIRKKYVMNLLERISPFWIKSKIQDDLLPPYNVYGNVNFKDPARLEKIFEESRHKKNMTIESFDFLRDPSVREHTRYESHFNNLGFRSRRDFNPEKTKGVTRIITYGSYQAYGHALDENDTYSAKLERKLNEGLKKPKYEVWNSGRHAGTAIVGLAQFKHDAELYHPDIILVDYGFVDAAVMDDNFFSMIMHYSSEFKEKFEGPIWAANKLLSHSVLAFRLWMNYSFYGYKQNTANFLLVMDEFKRLAKEHNVKIVFVRQSQVNISDLHFTRLAGNEEYLNVAKLFADHEAEFAKKDQGPAYWMNEIPESWHESMLQYPDFKYPKLKLDLWQTNADGNELIATELAKRLKAAPKTGEPLP